MSVTLVDSPEVVRVVAESPLTHLCPHVDEVDHGTVRVKWTTRGKTVELHSLRAWLQSFGDAVISHERITNLIRDELAALEGLADVGVETRWETAEMDVKCST